MTVLQRKIESLSKSQQAEVLKFVDQLIINQKESSSDAFDKQILLDAGSGKLDNLAEDAILQFQKGNFKQL